jgi:hypothetical protein
LILFSAAIKPSLRIFGSETEGSKNGQSPDRSVSAQEIGQDLEAALEQFCEIAADLGGEETQKNS